MLLLKERGYVYPVDYLMEVADRGDSLLFRGDDEWLNYMIARAASVEYEEDER
jgi:hypothetical protein